MTIHMDLGADSYDIVVERGGLFTAAKSMDLQRRVLIVTDDGVPGVYVKELAAQCEKPCIHTIAQGEESKNTDSLTALLRHMMEAGFDRSDCVCALGGGVVGDLAGLAASCYMRGIDYYIMPTTLLAQVDSAIGGKTAVDLDGAKNVVGTFWQPRCVQIDPDLLDTLPSRHFRAGLAEIIKAGIVADAALFSIIEEGGEQSRLEEVIERALRVKKTVVEEDVRDTGRRRILNFGHTIGHGIESVTGLLHGECVAMGMIPMCGTELKNRLLPLLGRLQLPTCVRADRSEVYRAILHDKKIKKERITIVRSDAPGSCRLETVSPTVLPEWIKEVVKT